ncbi:MMPL family transporter [Demequina gelatinilytica]|uniref:MMPL family transporter n=1 Tax=Demequina gelatinilytica TaxID=1638980 RepID=UPI0007863542|nr:MMPL family transporter [Demequina gelatinilytica]
MTHLATALAGAATRRPRTMLAAWAVLMAALAVSLGVVGAAYSDELTVPGSDSAVAAELLAEIPEGATSSIVVAAPVALTGPAAAARLDTVLKELAEAAGEAIEDPLADPASAMARGSLSHDGTAVSVPLAVDPDDLTESQLDAIRDVLERGSVDGWQVAAAGDLARALDLTHTRFSEAVGLAAAIVALSIGLGSIAAMAAPVVAGVVAVGTGLAMLGLLSHSASIPEIAPTLATMIGLGVGIDYALFQVARMRQLLARGTAPRDAVIATAGSAGTAAAFAGTTVALAICALALSGVAFIGWLGYAAAIVVAVVVVTALTFTPALLTLMAPRLTPRASRGSHEGRWIARVTRSVVARPWASAIGAFAALAVLAAPALSLTLGTTGPGDRPEGTQSRTSYDLRADRFGDGANATLTVAVRLDTPATGASDPRLVELSAAIADAGGASSTPLVPLATDPAVATARVTPPGDANDDATAVLIEDLRTIEAPEGSELHVGGATATRLDLEDRVAQRLPWVVAAVVAASMLVLMVAFRSVLVPLKAALLNLVSVAAAYGVVVAVFQWGWGASLLGLDGPVALDAFVPMILFAVLFGLSTDYEVFLVTAMREHWDRTGDAPGAIVAGMRSSGRVVTIAAVIMIAVFASFAFDADPTIKVFGVGLAASIILDATLIRMVLVPALMALLGRRAWWVPRWLDRILPAPHGATSRQDEPTQEAHPTLVGDPC